MGYVAYLQFEHAATKSLFKVYFTLEGLEIQKVAKKSEPLHEYRPNQVNVMTISRDAKDQEYMLDRLAKLLSNEEGSYRINNPTAATLANEVRNSIIFVTKKQVNMDDEMDDAYDDQTLDELLHGT